MPLYFLLNRLKLRSTLVIAFTFLILIAVIPAAYLLHISARRSVYDLVYQIQTEIIARIDLTLHDYLKTPHQIIQTNIEEVRLGHIDMRKLEGLQRHFWEQNHIFNRVSAIMMGNEQGEFCGVEMISDSLWYLTLSDRSTGFAFHTYIADEFGRRKKLFGVSPNYDPRIRPWYKKAVKTGSQTWSDAYFFPLHKTFYMASVSPIYDFNGVLEGVIASSFDISQIGDFLRSLKIGKSGKTFIIDSSGIVISSSTIEQPFLISKDGKTAQRLKAFDSQDRLISIATQHISAKFGGLNNIVTQSQFIFEFDRQKQISMIYPFKDEFGLDWRIVIVAPESDFIGEVNANMRISLILIFVLLTLSILISIMVARWIITPLLHLNIAAKEIAQGNWSKKIDIQRQDEIGELATSFSIMSASLQQRHAEQLQMQAQLKNAYTQIEAQYAQLITQNEELTDLNEELQIINKQLSEKQASLSSLIRISPEVIAVVTQEKGQILEVNEAFERVMGFTREESMGYSAIELGLWENSEEREQIIGIVKERHSIHNFETRLRRKSGEIFPAMISMASIEVDGQPCVVTIMIDITQQKRTEEELREQKERLSAILNATTSLIALIDRNGIVVELNTALAERFHSTKEQMIGKNMLDMFPPAVAEQRRKWIESVINTGVPVRVESEREGIWVDAVHHPVFDAAGNPVEIAVFAMDITERKKSEQTLRESEENYRRIVDLFPDLIAIHQKGKIIFMNKGGCILLGATSPDQVVGRPVTDFVSPEYRESSKERIKQLLKDGRSPIYEQKLLRIDKTEIDVEVVGITFPYKGDIAVQLIGRDVTMRKKAQEELQQTKNYLDNILNSSPSAIISVDNNGIITGFNLAAEKISGVSVNAATGKKICNILSDYTDCMTTVKRVIKEKKPLIIEKIRVLYNQQERFNDIFVYPLVADNVDGAVLRIDDVTERVRLHEMMIQTEKMMSVGGLAAGMAHEINNPLAGILQSTQNILRRISIQLPVNEKIAQECGTELNSIRSYLEKRDILKYLEGIRESGERAAKIVENMLSFSRRSESQMAPYDLSELLDKTIELAAHDYDLKKKYDFRNIEIIKDFEPNLPKILCKATEIEQVILNLLRNSAQAMALAHQKIEPPRITLRLKKHGDIVCIEVEDNGPGMDEQIRKRVFEPFFTTKEAGAGTGLGLSVSYFIITNNHQGKMSVESQPGKGTKFVILIPTKR